MRSFSASTGIISAAPFVIKSSCSSTEPNVVISFPKYKEPLSSRSPHPSALAYLSYCSRRNLFDLKLNCISQVKYNAVGCHLLISVGQLLGKQCIDKINGLMGFLILDDCKLAKLTRIETRTVFHFQFDEDKVGGAVRIDLRVQCLVDNRLLSQQPANTVTLEPSRSTQESGRYRTALTPPEPVENSQYMADRKGCEHIQRRKQSRLCWMNGRPLRNRPRVKLMKEIARFKMKAYAQQEKSQCAYADEHAVSRYPQGHQLPELSAGTLWVERTRTYETAAPLCKEAWDDADNNKKNGRYIDLHRSGFSYREDDCSTVGAVGLEFP